MSAKHCFFDDHAATRWLDSLAAGLAEAAASGKCVLVQLGRPDCGGSRALIERVLPKEEITEVLRESFVCVCLDSRSPGAEAEALLAQLPRVEPTPICMYLVPQADGSGRIVHSTVGGRPPAVFMRDLVQAQSATGHHA